MPLKIRLPPDAVVFPMSGLLLDNTLRMPAVFNCDVSQAGPGPGVAGVMFTKGTAVTRRIEQREAVAPRQGAREVFRLNVPP